MMQLGLEKISVRTSLIDTKKYDFLFWVDTLNEWVKKGGSFGEAYQKIGAEIADENYSPNRNLQHSSIGSPGNLQGDALRKKTK